MKKIITLMFFLTILFNTIYINANQNVIVSAIVNKDGANLTPLILSVNPNSDPRILKTNKTQSYTIYFRDNEKDIINYTITPDNGYANPISGTINTSDYDTSSGAYINFLYLAPAIANPNEKIIVTIDDGTNFISKQLNLYIY